MRRFLPLLLAVSLLLCTLSLSVGAAGNADTFQLLRAIRISPTEVLLEFSEPLAGACLSHAFTALRRMRMTGDDIAGLAYDGETPLQQGATSHHFYSDFDHTRVIVCFPGEQLDRYLDPENKYHVRGYRTYFCIEEKNPPSGHSHASLQRVESKSGAELASNLPGPGGNWDGIYLPIEVDYTYRPNLPEPPAQTDPAPESGEAETSGSAGKDPDPSASSGCGGMLTVAPLPLILSMAFALRKKK